MSRTQRLHGFASLLLSVALCLAVFGLARTASAGTLRVRDDAHALSTADVDRLRSTVASSPFDAELAVTTSYPDAHDLKEYARSLVSSRGELAVALDPEHRHVELWFAGAHIPRAAWPGIERAGNEAFSKHAWGQGLESILVAAQESARVPGVADDRAPIQTARPSLVGPGLLILLIIAGVIGVAIFAARRRAYDGEYGGGGYGPPGGPYGGPYPGGYPVGPQPGGMGPLGGGIVGAGLGGLAGYELGKMEGEREERDRERSWERNDAGGGDDTGGGGSSWDDAGDSGGGFDGGGGDSGGGGSDF